jgi:hypothetical protein
MLENEIDLALVRFQILQSTGRSAIVINPKRIFAMVLEKCTNHLIV